MSKLGRWLLTTSVALVLLAAAPVGVATASGASSTPSPEPSASASAGGGASESPTTITYGLGPSTDGTFDRRPSIAMLAARTGSVSDEVTVINLSEVPLTLNLYAVDALNAPDGELALEPSSQEPTGLASWVSFDTPSGQGFVRVGPRGRVPVSFTVTVPADAPVGDHVAGIVVSSVADGETPGDRGTAIELEQRVGVRLAMRVAGQLVAELSVDNLSARYVGTPNPFGRGSAVVSYTIRNSGNVRLGGTQTVTVEGLVGSGATRVAGPDVPALLPGEAIDYEVTVEDVPPLLLMNARVDIQPLPAAGDADQQAPAVTESTTFWAVPWFLVTLLLTLLLLVSWWVRRRRAVAPPTPTTGRRLATSGTST